MSKSNTKIFGIGFHKTGTKSLKRALEILDYKVIGPNLNLLPLLKEKKYDGIWELVNQYDGFQDNPWSILYKELHKKYPNSKFILTHRSNESWINSIVDYFGTEKSDMRAYIYGSGASCPFGNESTYLKRYIRHNEEVIEYFKDTPDQFLKISLEEKDSWKKLCTFLGKRQPLFRRFPHLNSSSRK